MGDVISSFVFHPPSPANPLELRQPTSRCHMELTWLTTSKGSRIPAIHINRRQAVFTVLYSHGNAEDLGMLIDYLYDLSKILNVSVMAYDYTGYGFSNRSYTTDNPADVAVPPSEEHCYADIEAAYEYLVVRRRIKPCHIVLYGRSLGSGPSCYLAQKLAQDAKGGSSSAKAGSGAGGIAHATTAGSGYSFKRSVSEATASTQESQETEKTTTGFGEDHIGGLILHSPFTSICRTVVDLGFTFQGDMFCNIERMCDVRCPALVIHGTHDDIVPVAHGRSLHDAIPARSRVVDPLWADGMGHNNIELEATREFITTLLDFFLCIEEVQQVEEGSSVGQGTESKPADGPSKPADGPIHWSRVVNSSCVTVKKSLTAGTTFPLFEAKTQAETKWEGARSDFDKPLMQR